MAVGDSDSDSVRSYRRKGFVPLRRCFLFVVMPFAMVMAAAVAEGQRSVQEEFDYLSDLYLVWRIRKKCRPVGFLIYG